MTTPLTANAIASGAAARLGLKPKAIPRHDPLVYDNPADFIENEMYIPETGAAMTLHPEQRAVLEAMAARDALGNFLYSLWLWSAPKKSAKTTIGAGVALWQAWSVCDGEIYIIGNDLKQADSRMAQAIRYAVEHNPRMVNRVKVTASKYHMLLDNGTRIEAIPVDPRGEAGANPSGIFWTEAWGAIGERAEHLWTEVTLSPTRSGKAFKFVESYAGYSGESLILERLYNSLVKRGAAYPDLPEVYTTPGAIAYWCTRRYLDWQVNAPNYYRQEEAEKTPSEFRRIHLNEWVTSENVFIQPEWWDACKADFPQRGPFQSMVVGIDAGVSNDCFAIVGVTKEGERVAVRYARVWKPPEGGTIDFSEPEAELRRLGKEGRVACFTYDPMQLHDMATRLTRAGVGWFQAFDQGAKRLVADKQLHDMIRDRRLMHDGNAILTEHVKNANAKTEGDKLRIIKRADHLKIDAAVCLSMATARARELNV